MSAPSRFAVLKIVPRALVVLIGLFYFHALSGDPLASWPMIGVAAFSLLARATGSIRFPSVRIQLSIAASVCVLLFIQGGNAVLYANPSALLIALTLVWVIGLNLINFYFPVIRLPMASFAVLALLGGFHLIEPGHESGFANEIQYGLLLVLAWELLSAPIVSKRDSPSIFEVGSALAFLLLYYYRTADFTIALASLAPLLIAHFIASSMRVHSESPEYHYIGSVQNTDDPKTPRKRRIAYSVLALAGFGGLFATAYTLSLQTPAQPFLVSLDLPAQTLAVETRDRSAQIRAAEIADATQTPDLLTPEDTSRPSAQRRDFDDNHEPPPPPKRRVIVRHVGEDESDSGYLNVERDSGLPTESRMSHSPPALDLSAPQTPTLLPGYTGSPETLVTESTADDTSRSISLGIGFDTTPDDEPSFIPGIENIQDNADDGDAIRVSAPLPTQPTQSIFSEPETPDSPTPDRSTAPASQPRNVQAPVGFASILEFANNVSVQLKTRPVLEVYLPQSIRRPEKLYLRFNALETLRRDRFVQRPQAGEPDHRLSQTGWNRAPEPFQSNSDADDIWTLALASNWSSEAPLLGPFQSLQIPKDTEFTFNAAQFSMRRTSGSGPLAYRFRGIQLSDTRPANEAKLSQSERTLLTSLDLDRNEMAFLRRLSSQIAGRNATPDQFAERAGRYFQRRHPYRFDFAFKSSDDENLLIAWLRTRSPGICGYYAGAFTLLARAQGIPARVVIGALSREYDPKQRKFIVRDRDAHAWAEYFDEDNQWVRADLTPFTYDTPRFAQNAASAEGFETGIATALDTLDVPSENAIAALDSPTTQPNDPGPNDETTSELREKIPSTLAILDKILDNEPDLAVEPSSQTDPEISETLAAESPTAVETEPAPSPEPAPPAVAAAPPIEQTNTRIATPETNPNPSTAVPEQGTVTTKSTPFLTPKRIATFVFIFLASGFVFAQLRALFTRSPQSSEDGLPPLKTSRERALAGKILHEIDRRQRVPQLRDLLDPLRRQALNLRYSPHCDPRDVKRLKRKLARVLADAPVVT